jgi:hypothetical protein
MAIKFGFKEIADSGMELNFLGNIKGTEKIGEDGNVLSFKERPVSEFEIKFILKIDTDIFSNVLPEGNVTSKDFSDVVNMNLFYESIASRQRGLISLSKDTSSSNKDVLFYSGHMTIDPALWFGDINFKGIAVRSIGCPQAEGFKTLKNSILGATAEKRLYIDPFAPSAGGQLDVKIGEVDDYTGVLYKLDKKNLVVLINNKAPKQVQQILSCEYQTGLRASLRDALFEPILIDVTEQLAREAIHLMLANIEDGYVDSPLELDEPYQSVACDIARLLFQDRENDEQAFAALKDNLYDEESRIEIINKELPMIVQSLSKVQKLYESISKEIIKDRGII